jgi:uncharacterized membrane protein YozB (DUF420 family)
MGRGADQPVVAPWRADATLVVEVAMGLALGAGAVLARRGQITAHKSCQSAVVLLNLLLVLLTMGPSFHASVRPDLPAGLRYPYHAVATVHAVLGSRALLLALYVVLAAGTPLLPVRYRLVRYKPWMRATLAFWWLALGLGVVTYVVWYAPPLTTLLAVGGPLRGLPCPAPAL